MWLCQHGTHMALMGKEHGLITPHDLLVLSAFLRRELSGMIHWRTIKNPSNPQHPIHSLRKTHQEVLTHWYWWNMDLSMENNDVYLYSMVYPKLIGLNLHITWGSSFDGFPTTLPWKSIREVAEMRRTSAQSSWWHLHRIPVSHISSSDGIITYKLYIYDIYISIIYVYTIYILSPEHSHISHDIHHIHHIPWRIFAIRCIEANRGLTRFRLPPRWPHEEVKRAWFGSARGRKEEEMGGVCGFTTLSIL